MAKQRIQGILIFFSSGLLHTDFTFSWKLIITAIKISVPSLDPNYNQASVYILNRKLWKYIHKYIYICICMYVHIPVGCLGLAK